MTGGIRDFVAALVPLLCVQLLCAQFEATGIA
jgi:hypothetical protein